MNRIVAKLCFGIMLAVACASGEEAPVVEKLVQVKHVEADQRLHNLFDVLGVRVSDRVGGYIALKGSKDAVAAAEEALHHMDEETPESNVELTGWLVVASTHSAPELQPLPEDLASVAKQLKAAFGYADLRVLTSFVVRTRAGSEMRNNGQFSNELVGGKEYSSYSFHVNRVEVAGDAAGTHRIRLDNVQLSLGNGNLSSDVDLNEGQKVVIGKTTMGIAAGMPLILVLSTHVVTE
jgi:hypothetical protein